MKPFVAVALMAAAAAAVAAGEPARVPLQAGVTIVTALADRQGDYESIKTISAVTADEVKLTYSADIPAAPGGRGAARKVSTRRTVKRDDLRSSVYEYSPVSLKPWPAPPRSALRPSSVG